jgi:hypothetical protein
LSGVAAIPTLLPRRELLHHFFQAEARRLKELQKTFARHPFDRDTLSALAAFWRETGDFPKAVTYAKRLRALEEADPELVMR